MIYNRVLQLVFTIIGISVFVWAFSDPRFRNTEGFLDGTFCLMVSIGAALIILGWKIAGRLGKPAFWFVLTLVGQAVILQMIEAGPYCNYQHFKPLKDIHPILLIYLAVQTVFVVAGFRARWAKMRVWLGRHFKLWQLLGVGLVFFLYSATMSSNITVYLTELFFAAFVQAVNLGNIVLVVWALPTEAIVYLKQKLDKIFGQSQNGEAGIPKKWDRFALCAAIWVTVFAGILCVVSYEKHPHIPDEISYIYQARYFAEGMITMPAPAVPEAFNLFLMDNDHGRWYSAQLPGWPAVLAFGFLLGVPWLVNPVLAGVNILLISHFLLELYDRRTARMTVFLLCFSPWYIFMAINFMGHTFTLTCALVAALAVLRARKSSKAIWGWLGGIAVGMMSLIRPLEALALAGLLGLWAIGIGGKRLKYSAIVGLLIGAMIIGSAGLFYNKYLTGHPAKFPFMVCMDKVNGPGSNALGFGPNRGFGWHKNYRFLDPYPGHSPLESFINANLNIFAINTELFGWSTGSLVLIAIVLFSRKMCRSDRIMLAVICAIIGIHTFYWFSGGPDFGARYWFLIIVPCVVLTVRGIEYLVGKLNSDSDQTRGVHAVIAVVLLCMMALLNYIPWRAVDKYHHYRGFRPDIRKLAKEYDFGKALILISGNNYNEYPSAAIYNPVDLRDDKPVYAWDASPEIRRQLLQNYSDRMVWILNGPSVTHKGFEVAAGPVSAAELLSQE